MADGRLLPQRDLVLVLTIAVIVTTLVVQGFTLAPLVRRTGIALTSRDTHQEHTAARTRITEAALAYLDEIQQGENAPEFAIEQLRRSWKARLGRLGAGEGDEPTDIDASHSYRQLRQDLLALESAELDRMHRGGDITDTTRRRIERILDLEQAGLSDEP